MSHTDTDIVFVLDRSGSMAAVQEEVIGGFNKFLDEQKALPGKAKMSMTQFDTEFDVIYNGIDLASVKPLTAETFVPRGSTALNDAVCKAIDETGIRLKATPTEDRADQVLFVILTDGHENSSKEYTSLNVKEKINHQHDKYKWQFTFLGAGVDSFDVGAGYGIPQANINVFTASAMGTAHLFSSLTSNVRNYRSSGPGVSYNASITPDIDPNDPDAQAKIDLNKKISST